METEGDKQMVNRRRADKRPLATKISKKIQPLQELVQYEIIVKAIL